MSNYIKYPVDPESLEIIEALKKHFEQVSAEFVIMLGIDTLELLMEGQQRGLTPAFLNSDGTVYGEWEPQDLTHPPPEPAPEKPEDQFKEYNMRIDEVFAYNLEDLRQYFGKENLAQVIKLAVTLLKIAKEGQENGLKLTLSNMFDSMEEEIDL